MATCVWLSHTVAVAHFILFLLGGANFSDVILQPANVPTGTNEKHGDINAGVSHEQSIPDETIGIEDKLKIEGDSSSKEGSNPTLNRINL